MKRIIDTWKTMNSAERAISSAIVCSVFAILMIAFGSPLPLTLTILSGIIAFAYFIDHV